MAKNNEGINKKVLMIGGGVIIVLVLVLVGVYGKNITTQVYQAGSPATADPKCATQAEKDTAQKKYNTIKGDITISTDFIASNAQKIVNKEKEIQDIRKATPVDNDKLLTAIKELSALEDTQDGLARTLVLFTDALAVQKKILALPLCKSSPTPTPTKKPSPTPTPSPKSTPTPSPTFRPTPTSSPVR